MLKLEEMVDIQSFVILVVVVWPRVGSASHHLRLDSVDRKLD